MSSVTPSKPRRPHQPPSGANTSPRPRTVGGDVGSAMARVREGDSASPTFTFSQTAGSSSWLCHETMSPNRRSKSANQNNSGGVGLTTDAFIQSLKVQFPDAQGSNLVRRTLDVALTEAEEYCELRGEDQSKVKLQMDRLQELMGTLEDQMELPVSLLQNTSINVQAAQREAKRIAVEEVQLRRSVEPSSISIRSPFPVNPSKSVVCDDAGDKKLRLTTEMLNQNAAEVVRLRGELAAMSNRLSSKEDKILELEAAVHSSNLSMVAMELAMTKLKRKAAVGGGGGFRPAIGVGGGSAASSPLAAAASGGTAASGSISEGSGANAGLLGNSGSSGGPNSVPTGTQHLISIVNDVAVQERITLTRRAIYFDRRRWIAENPSLIQIDGNGQDFGPQGRIAVVVLGVPCLAALAARYPRLVDTVIDTLRDTVRSMLEISDGFEFRHRGSMFACAFDDPTSALDFAMNLTNQLHNMTAWPRELEHIEEFRTIYNETGVSIFRGLRASIAVHTGQWTGAVDLLCLRKMYEGELLDKTIICCKSCPPGLVFATNETISATGVREFLGDRSAVLTAIPPWGVHVVLSQTLKERVAKANAPPEAPLSRNEIQVLLNPDLIPLAPENRLIVCIQVEGFLNAIIDGEIPQKDLYRSLQLLEEHLVQQMQWCGPLTRGGAPPTGSSGSPPEMVREESGRYVILFDNAMDAFDFSLSLQQDLMRLPWPESIFATAFGAEERAEIPRAHRFEQLVTTPGQLPSQITAFRGPRLQIGIHAAKCANTRLRDWFTGGPKWTSTEINVAIGLSCYARGGETLASALARDALYEEQRRCKDDTRMTEAAFHRIPKKMIVSGCAEVVDGYWVSTLTLIYRFRDTFPESIVSGLFRLQAYGVSPMQRMSKASTTIVAIAVSHAPVLQTTSPEAHRALHREVEDLVFMCCRRFRGTACISSDVEPTPLCRYVCVFSDAKVAALATMWLHWTSLRIELDDQLTGTPFTSLMLGTDNQTLYSGPRLKIGFHVGVPLIAQVPPAVPMPLIAGDPVYKALLLCEKATSGTTLLSSAAESAIHDWALRYQGGSAAASRLYLYELLDCEVKGFAQKGNFQVLLPMELKERVMRTPPTVLDAADAVIHGAAGLQLAMLRPSGSTSRADGDDADAPTHEQCILQTPNVPLYSPTACVVDNEPQMFVVCRLPGYAMFAERAPFAREVLKLYLQCARELLRPLRGRELRCEVDALLLTFPNVITAVQWAQQVQVSLVCAKWPVEVLSTDFGKEVRSATRGGSQSNRVGSLFRGPRALISMDWGCPKRKFDSTVQDWHFFGEVPQYVIELSHWGHGGMIVLSKRAKMTLTEAMTQETTRQMLESPNIVTIGQRVIQLPSAGQGGTANTSGDNSASGSPGTTSPATQIVDVSLSGTSKLGPASEASITGSPPASTPDPLFSLVPLVFFERQYPPFPEAPSEERRFTALAQLMCNLDCEDVQYLARCLIVTQPGVQTADDDDDGSEAAAISNHRKSGVALPASMRRRMQKGGASKALSGSIKSNTAESALGSSILDSTALDRSGSIFSSSVADGGNTQGAPQPHRLSEIDLELLQPFLSQYYGRVHRWSGKGISLDFPHAADAVAFCLAFASEGAGWARHAHYAVDVEPFEIIATLLMPFGNPGEVVVTEELLQLLDPMRGVSLAQSQALQASMSMQLSPSSAASKQSNAARALLQNATLGRYSIADAIPVDDMEAPPLRIVTLAPIRTFHALPPRGADVSATFVVPSDIWKKKPKPIEVVVGNPAFIRDLSTSQGAVGGEGGGLISGVVSGRTSPTSEGGTNPREGGSQAREISPIDIHAPFERNQTDENFAVAVSCLDPNRDSESGRLLQQLWEQHRQVSAEESRRVKHLESQVAQLTEKIERMEASSKINTDLMLKAHRSIRQYRTRLDAYFKKAMVEEVVYGNDADLFVTDWITSMRGGTTTGVGVAAGGFASLVGAVLTKTKGQQHALSPREEFSSMMRHAIDDDGTESRAHPNRLFASYLGHLNKIFSGVERLLKQRERISRLGAVAHRKVSVRPPGLTDRGSAGRASIMLGSPAGGLLSQLAPSSRGQSLERAGEGPKTSLPAIGLGGPPGPSEDRKQNLRSKLRSVLLMDGGLPGTQPVGRSSSLTSNSKSPRGDSSPPSSAFPNTPKVTSQAPPQGESVPPLAGSPL